MAKVLLCVFHRVLVIIAIGVFISMIQQHNVSAKDGSLKQQVQDAENIPKRLSEGKESEMSDKPFDTVQEKRTEKITASETTSKRLLQDHENMKYLEELQFDALTKESNEAPDHLAGHLKKLGELGSNVLIGEIEDIDYVPNGRDFYTHFLRKQRPLVMRGAAADWSAVKHWPNETYMREKYGHVIFDVEFTKHYERIHPIKKTMNLSEYLDIYKSKQVYLDCPFPQTDLTSDIMVPYCLQCEEVMSTIASIHLLYSSGNTSSSLHQDGYQNFLTLISGTKEVLIANSKYAQHLYANNYTTVPGLSPVNPESVDLKTFPNVSKVIFHKVVLKAGDILYIPQHWWHHVRSFDCPNIAISLWFHPFAEKEEEQSSLLEDDSADPSMFEDMVYVSKAFDKLVESYPETIKCHSQNKPITDVFTPKSDAWDTPREIRPEDSVVTLASGYKMPKIGFGTAGLFKDTKSSVLVALTSGYRMIDSAQAYDEEQVGAAVQESGIPREDVFIVSKVHPRFLGYDRTLKSVEETLTKLKVDYIDLMLIHSMDCDEGPGALLICQDGEPKGTWEDSWKALESLVEKGTIRSIGVSNFEVQDLERLLEISKIHPSVVQNSFDPFSQDRLTREFCKKRNIHYMGHSTLGDSWKRDGLPLNPVLSDEGLRKISSKFDASIPQVVLKWSLENDVIVIPRSRNPNHIKTNLHLTHVLLDEDDRQYIENLDGKIIVPDDDPPFDSRSKPSVSDQEVTEEEKTTDESAKLENIVDKVVLTESVNPDDSTLYLSSDDHWIYAFDAATGKLKWKYGTGDEGGSKCVFNSDETVVYCGTDDKSLRALDAADGSLVWKFSTGGAVTSSTRVGADGSLYFGCLDGYFYAVNSDGSLKWKKNLGVEIWSSPALLEGGKAVFVGSMAEDSANVFSLDGQTGETIWKYETAGPVFSSPSVSHDSKAVFFCSFDANCYAFSTEDGRQLWMFEGDSAFQSSPVVSKLDGTVFVGSSQGNIYAIDSSNGQVKWTREGEGELFSSPFIAPDGNIYIGSGQGEVLALRQHDGSLVWSFKTSSSIWSSPRLDKSGLLFIGGIDTFLYALQSEDGQLVWKYKTDGPVVGTPLITREHAVEQA